VPGVFEMVEGGPIRVDGGSRAGATVAGGAARTPGNPQQSRGTMPLSSKAADPTCRVNDGTARRMPGPGINFRPDGTGLWNRPYTL
jgi:hypothetical protein